MARYDERGVVIPAPLQGSDAALAGQRYGDKHRGPAVTDAYELSHCWIDLAERSENWSSPADLPSRMIELAKAFPEDQRADWLRRQANLDEVDRRISYAIRSGDLPIWVAPEDGPERRVAAGALATIDKRSIQGGVFCPLSEEYKADADRPWLWERPLFVKWEDWVRFAEALDSEKRQTPRPDPSIPLLPPDFQYVTLSHALSWIAFGVSMDSDHLHEVLANDQYGEHDPQQAIADALENLLDLAGRERLIVRGKYRASRDSDPAKLDTMLIEPIKFADYRQFSYLDDELRHGRGLLFWHDENGQVFHDTFGSKRRDGFAQVTVSRTDLLREFRPHSAMGIDPDANLWTDLDPIALERAKELAFAAQADEWWNWPQAVAWVGGRDLQHIATMRLSAEQWREKDDHQFEVALGAERYLAELYCAGNPSAEIDLQRAIERGAIRTLGRAAIDSPAHELKPTDWRGGKVVYYRTATLVSATNLLSNWACDIAVHRRDLFDEFPADGCTAAAEPNSLDEGTIVARAPAVKTGRPPSDEEIIAKADEMKARGMGQQAIAKEMRLEPGFENVATTEVRKLILGRWPRGRPPKN